MTAGVRLEDKPETVAAELYVVIGDGGQPRLLSIANAGLQLGAGMLVALPDGTVKLLSQWLADLVLAAASGGQLGYPTKAAMVSAAPTAPPTGTMRVVTNDPADVNGSINGAWRYDPAVAGDHWEKSADQVSALRADVATMKPQVANAAAAVDGIYKATGALRPVAWMDTTSYEVAWLASLTNIATRLTVTPSPGGLTLVGLGAMPGAQPIAVRLKQAVIPGRLYYFRAKFTGGTLGPSNGFFVGNDTATSGNISTNAQPVVRRGGLLVPSLANATASDGTRAVTPAFAAPAFAIGTDLGLLVEVLADFSLLVKNFHDGRQFGADVVVGPAATNSALMVGVVLSAGQTVFIEEVDIRTASGNTLFVHSGVSSSGTGSRGSPLKSLTDIPGAIIANGLIGQPVTINCLTDNLYEYLECKETLSPLWTINGLPGGNTVLNGFNFGEVPVWTVVSGTGGKVSTTPTKHGPDTVSHANQVFIFGRSWNPRPWYNFPNTCLESMQTTNGGLDMVGKTNGAIANSGGLLYLRLPDGMPSADPSAYPTGGYSLVVARTVSVISVIGSPQVNLNNITLRWSAGPLFAGGAGFGTITGCVFEWGGYNAPNIQVENGQYVIRGGGHSKYSDGDGIGRSMRIDEPFQNGSTLITTVEDFEISHTGSQAGASGGDAISDHIPDPDSPPFDTSNRRSILNLKNVKIHDCWKCGVVTSDDEVNVTGITIERCGTEQFALLGVPSSPAVGRTQRARVNGFKFDPQGLGTTGVRLIGTDGMALAEIDLTNGHIGMPAAGGKELEVAAQALTVSGVPQPRDATKNIIRYTNVTTERDAGSVVKTGDGLATGLLTFSTNPANGDTVTIDAVTYTFNTTLSGANSIKIGGSSMVTRNNLIGAIMADPLLITTGYGAGTSVHPTVTALPAAGNVKVIAKTAGTGGNDIVTTEASAALSFGTGTLTGGAAAMGTFVPVTAHRLT
jgi:hypothetical protein